MKIASTKGFSRKRSNTKRHVVGVAPGLPQRRASLGREAISQRERYIRERAKPQRRASLGREAIAIVHQVCSASWPVVWVASGIRCLNEGLLSEEKQCASLNGASVDPSTASTKGFSRKRSNTALR